MFSYAINKGPQIDSVSQESKRIHFHCFSNNERVVRVVLSGKKPTSCSVCGKSFAQLDH